LRKEFALVALFCSALALSRLLLPRWCTPLKETNPRVLDTTLATHSTIGEQTIQVWGLLSGCTGELTWTDEERAFAGWKDTSFDPISASAQTTSLDFHDEILSIVKETGLDSLAAETGLLQDGEIPSLRRYSSKSTYLPRPPVQGE
jgi:hypothetical protein